MAKIRAIIIELTPYSETYELRIQVKRWAMETLNSVQVMPENRFVCEFDRLMERAIYQLKDHINRESKENAEKGLFDTKTPIAF